MFFFCFAILTFFCQHVPRVPGDAGVPANKTACPAWPSSGTRWIGCTGILAFAGMGMAELVTDEPRTGAKPPCRHNTQTQSIKAAVSVVGAVDAEHEPPTKKRPKNKMSSTGRRAPPVTGLPVARLGRPSPLKKYSVLGAWITTLVLIAYTPFEMGQHEATGFWIWQLPQRQTFQRWVDGQRSAAT